MNTPTVTDTQRGSLLQAGWNFIKAIGRFAGNVLSAVVRLLSRPPAPLTQEMKTHLLDQWETAIKHKRGQQMDLRMHHQFSPGFAVMDDQLSRDIRTLEYKIANLREKPVVAPSPVLIVPTSVR